MNKKITSGLYSDEFGQLILATQGIAGYTLVANKKILFRLFLDVAASNITAVLARVTHTVFGIPISKKNILIPSGSLLIENTSPNGPSVGILFTGDVFAHPGEYEITFSVHGNPSAMPHFKIPELVFSRPGRLRLLIHNLVGTAPWGTKIESDFGWLIDMFQSLERLSAMLPVRDGLRLGLNHTDAGICFSFGENIDPWTCPSGPCTTEENIEKLLRQTKEINAAGTSERVDATIGWRPRDPTFPAPGGESVGGRAFFYDSPPGTGLASFVGGNLNGKEFTAPIMAQEIGHLFGLEPQGSPHFEDPADGLHSKDRSVIDPFAFDFYLLKPYQPLPGRFVGDVMNNTGGGMSQGRDMVLYNAFDWEHLRKKFVQLPGASPFIAAEERLTKEQQDDLVNDWHNRFVDEPEILVANPVRALSTKEGFMWHWTPLGFQRLRRTEDRKNGSGLSSSVEDIRSWLEDLDTSEVYTTVADHPLSMVINPNISIPLHRKEFDLLDAAEGATPHR